MSAPSPLGMIASMMSNISQMAVNMATQFTRMNVNLIRSVDSSIPSPTAVLPKFGQAGPLSLPSPQQVFKPLQLVTNSAGFGGTSTAEESRDNGSVGF